MMMVGMKYCGGCNPRHDRGDFAARVRETFDAVHQIELAEEGKEYDYLLLIGGCANCCASYAPYRVRKRIITVASEPDFENVVYHLDHKGQERMK